MKTERVDEEGYQFLEWGKSVNKSISLGGGMRGGIRRAVNESIMKQPI